jgi:hypothetical protein
LLAFRQIPLPAQLIAVFRFRESEGLKYG